MYKKEFFINQEVYVDRKKMLVQAHQIVDGELLYLCRYYDSKRHQLVDLYRADELLKVED